MFTSSGAGGMSVSTYSPVPIFPGAKNPKPESCAPSEPRIDAAAMSRDPVPSPGPVGPVNPVAPVGPVGPVGPVDPVAPVGPVGPVNPVGPVGPVNPVGPVGPVAPVSPRLPRRPRSPRSPSPSSSQSSTRVTSAMGHAASFTIASPFVVEALRHRGSCAYMPEHIPGSWRPTSPDQCTAQIFGDDVRLSDEDHGTSKKRMQKIRPR